MRFHLPVTILIILLLHLQYSKVIAQQQGEKSLKYGINPGFSVPDSVSGTIKWLDINPRYVTINDTVWIYSGICKALKKIRYTEPANVPLSDSKSFTADSRKPFLSIHGNIQYDFLHRSYVDTPFAQNNFQQHTIQTSLSIVAKDKYPMRVNLYTRQSNSPYFRNFLDAGLHFDPYTYTKSAKQELLNQIADKKMKLPDLTKAEAELSRLVDKYNALKQRLREPDIQQLLIEERERDYFGLKAPTAPPSIDPGELNQRFTYKNLNASYLPNADSAIARMKGSSYSAFIESKKHELDSLQRKISFLQQKKDSLRNAVENGIQASRQKIYKATNRRQLQKIAEESGLIQEKKNSFENFLADVKSIGIGRGLLNYSELTAWNVSLTGFNMEYNPPGIYAAIAAGKIDYGFRDFLGKNSSARNQELLMGRIGLGDKDSKAIIFSAFTGKKYNYGGIIADTVSDYVKVSGYSIEALWKKDEYNAFSAEVAKSTKPVSGTSHPASDWNSLINFSDKSNLGISIKGKASIPETDTRLSGFFRKTGQNFQSFNLFTYNTDQTAWLFKMDQSFMKNKIGLIAMLRRNDFVNPFTIKTFKTSTVFTSLQGSLRLPKWPVITAGYFPGTQLYIEDKERIRENAYYIVNGSAVYSYVAGGNRMVSSFIYNKYSSKGTDSGFISYRGINYIASQSLILRKAQLQGAFTYNDQEQMKYSTLEANAEYSITSFIRTGAGVKYNRVEDGDAYWGGRAQLNIELKSLGGIQLQYEKTYLPTVYRTLFPVEAGRLSWFKYF